MAGGSYGRSVSLSGSLTNALLIRSLAPRAMRPSGPILVVRALVPQDRDDGSQTSSSRILSQSDRLSETLSPPRQNLLWISRFHRQMPPQTTEATAT